MLDTPRLKDGFSLQLGRGREVADGFDGIRGVAAVELFDERGRLKHQEQVHNLITDAGDLWIAQQVITLIAPANAAAPTKMTGMKLGTTATAVAKASSGGTGALAAYLTTSNVLFDATYPQTANLGTTLGVTAVFKCTWGAGVATSATILEAVICNDAATNATSSLANTASRIIFSNVNKGASDTLAITWSWKFLGA